MLLCWQNGGECLRAFASVATEQLVAFRDDFGKIALTAPQWKAGVFLGQVVCVGVRHFLFSEITSLLEIIYKKKVTTAE